MPSTAGRGHTREIESPFVRLARTLDGIEPAETPIDLTVGEPRHAMPDFVAERLGEAVPAFSKYPPIRGSDDLRGAIAEWIARRYPGTAAHIEADRHILPLNGSREGLFSAIFPALERKPVADPAILIPNPFYHSYAAAAVAGVEPVFLRAAPETGFLPELDAAPAALLARTVAMYLSSPSNPQGAVASADYLKAAIETARRHDFMLFADECYSEVYADAPPPGALEAALEGHGDLANVAVFQSLSKRSNLAGLRSGFCAGDPAYMADFARLRNLIAPQVPLPVQHVSAAVWRDEAHVEASRALYREKFDAADAVLAGRYGHRRPEGGFFLWLDMSAHGGGEAAAQTLWKDAGVKVLPGAYLAKDGPDGANPGADFVRVALVQDVAVTEQALARMVATLG